MAATATLLMMTRSRPISACGIPTGSAEWAGRLCGRWTRTMTGTRRICWMRCMARRSAGSNEETTHMTFHEQTRRDFWVRLAAVLPAMGLAGNAVVLASPQADRNGISHTCDSIHQEVVFKASRKRVYEALTQSKRFAQVIDFIMKGASAEISPEVGGSFSIF